MPKTYLNGTFTVTNTRPAVSGTTAIVLASNSKRRWAMISNNTGAAVALKYGAAAVVAQGIPLADKATLHITEDELFLGAVHAIAGGAGNLDVVEGLYE